MTVIYFLLPFIFISLSILVLSFVYLYFEIKRLRNLMIDYFEHYLGDDSSRGDNL